MPGLGVERDRAVQTVVVDYSAPNVAKEMHVGNLRSTIIGDALCRILEHLGHDVRRENHIGDWGTPFGMLIEHLVDLGEQEAAHELSVGDLGWFYQQARASFDADEELPGAEPPAGRAPPVGRSGDPATLAPPGGRERPLLRRRLRQARGAAHRRRHRGRELLQPHAGRAWWPTSGHWTCWSRTRGPSASSPPGFTNREGDPLPLIVQKSDGGYGYAATDLASIRDRVDRIGATRILYVVGAPQAQHLQMCFAVAQMAGWLPEGTEAEHVSFGSVLGADRKMFKTRSGDSVKLVELLDEAVARAASAMAEREAGMSGSERDRVAQALGIGAVKYADLSNDRNRDYVFDWDRMLAFEGNTGPYLQYAHARIRSIFRRGEVAEPEATAPPTLANPHERALALQVLGFGEAVAAAAEASAPSKLCSYLYDLASAFTTFYENCPVLKADDEETRRSRLLLSSASARVLSSGLELLGMDAPERM